ncbi:hypothetical protein TNCV_202861 [Trichonephila clavipes]|nr:hypothetical protein TNCV_202861 [Trichonephila clavipes]
MATPGSSFTPTPLGHEDNLEVTTRTDPKNCACASAKPASVGVYLSTRAVDSVGSASERSVEIWSRGSPLDERCQDFVCSILALHGGSSMAEGFELTTRQPRYCEHYA